MRTADFFARAALLAGLSIAPLALAEDCCLASESEAALQAMDDRKFDPVLGQDTRNYPPDVQVDYQHLKLEIAMPRPETRSFTAVETLTFNALGIPARTLKLDAVGLQIEGVTDLTDRPLEFGVDDEHLTITLPEPLAPAAAGGVKITYAVTDPRQGMIFALPDEQYPSRAVQIHTQGQAETNRYWFAAHDYPNERMTTEILVTIPARYKALANGRLVERQELGDGMVRYHYALAKPHVSYLVSLVIGEFDVYTDRWRDIPVEYWVAPGSTEADVRRTFRRTPEMLEKFSVLTGVDYPYEKYAQSVVHLFAAGGMENTSTTTLTEDMLLDERASLDNDREGLIAHELGHQWYGDMLTCKSWQHIWLNEGFATYMDAAWQEHGFSRDHYDYDIWGDMRRVAESDDVNANGGLAWPYYEDGGETFRRGVSNPYPKGASVLHMLRMSVGSDELFWQCIRTYTRRHAWTSVESDDLRKVFDELTGRGFESFFQQWVHRPGSPNITVSYDWDAEARELTLSLRQTQPVSEKSPAFTAEIPVVLHFADGKAEARTLKLNARAARLVVPAETEPAWVEIDPGGTLLAKWDLGLPTKILARTATDGKDLTARLNAVAALATRGRPAAVEALNAVMIDPQAFFGLRVEAAKALGKMQTPAARKSLLDALAFDHPVADPKVRKAAVEALGAYRHPDAAEALRRIATTGDASYNVEAAAVEGLGKQEPTEENIAAVLGAAEKPSYRDQIRVAAAKALGRMGDPRGLPPIRALAAYGQPFRTRPNAIEAVAELGVNNESLRDECRKFLTGLLSDSQERARNAAIGALGTLGDRKAIESLRQLADSAVDKATRSRVRRAIDAINTEGGESQQVRELRQRVEALERARERRSEDK